jgi:hypothetical protein
MPRRAAAGGLAGCGRVVTGLGIAGELGCWLGMGERLSGMISWWQGGGGNPGGGITGGPWLLGEKIPMGCESSFRACAAVGTGEPMR